MRISYPVKQWIFTLLPSPLIISLFQSYASRSGGYAPGFGIYPFTLLFSIIMSMPVLLICYAVYDLLRRNRVDPSTIKIVSIVLSVAGIVGTMKVIFPEAPLWDAFKIVYCIFAVIGGLIFEIEDDSTEEDEAHE